MAFTKFILPALALTSTALGEFLLPHDLQEMAFAGALLEPRQEMAPLSKYLLTRLVQHNPRISVMARQSPLPAPQMLNRSQIARSTRAMSPSTQMRLEQFKSTGFNRSRVI